VIYGYLAWRKSPSLKFIIDNLTISDIPYTFKPILRVVLEFDK